MYVDDFICTYKLHDESDQENMYRSQFLQAFDLKEWDDKCVEERLSALYHVIKEDGDMLDIIAKAKTSKHLEMLLLLSGNDDETIFKTLFKFELFDMTHRCLSDVTSKKKMSSANKELLLNNL